MMSITVRGVERISPAPMSKKDLPLVFVKASHLQLRQMVKNLSFYPTASLRILIRLPKSAARRHRLSLPLELSLARRHLLSLLAPLFTRRYSTGISPNVELRLRSLTLQTKDLIQQRKEEGIPRTHILCPEKSPRL